MAIQGTSVSARWLNFPDGLDLAVWFAELVLLSWEC